MGNYELVLIEIDKKCQRIKDSINEKNIDDSRYYFNIAMGYIEACWDFKIISTTQWLELREEISETFVS